MRIIYIVLFASIIFGCSSIPFRKSDVGEGYTVKESPEKDRFLVTATLSPDNNSQFIWLYMMRAIGEECQARGFSYFYYAELSKFIYNGFCFSSAARKSIGIGFDRNANNLNSSRLVVTEADLKPSTTLKVGDEVTKIGGKAIDSWETFKKEIFLAAKSGRSDVSLDFMRNGQAFSTREALVQISEDDFGTNMGPEDLARLRDRIQ